MGYAFSDISHNSFRTMFRWFPTNKCWLWLFNLALFPKISLPMGFQCHSICHALSSHEKHHLFSCFYLYITTKQWKHHAWLGKRTFSANDRKPLKKAILRSANSTDGHKENVWLGIQCLKNHKVQYFLKPMPFILETLIPNISSRFLGIITPYKPYINSSPPLANHWSRLWFKPVCTQKKSSFLLT